FANGLFLTNQANAVQDTTQEVVTTRDAIVQVQLGEPDVRITKGVVSTDALAANRVFMPATVGPVTFAQIGVGDGFTGTVTSTNLTTLPINSDLRGVDAGDLVRFAIVLENRGDSEAFNVRFRDTLPTGFAAPGSGLNFRIYRGDGTLLTAGVDYNVLGTGL